MERNPPTGQAFKQPASSQPHWPTQAAVAALERVDRCDRELAAQGAGFERGAQNA